MLQIVLRILALTLSFILGLISTQLWIYTQSYNEPIPSIINPEMNNDPVNSKVLPLSFKSIAHGCGGRTDDGGFDSWGTGYKASDGTTLSITGISYESPQIAKKALEKNLKLVKGIIERTKIVNARDNSIEERIIAVILPNQHKQGIVIFYISGTNLRALYGPSLTHVLALEKEKGYSK
jgi:hypothetical protein